MCIPRTRKVPTQIFGNAWCSILRKPIHRFAAWQTDIEEKQTEWENENK